MVSSVKSGERLDMLILSILPSCSAITVATWARLPGSLTLSTMMRAGNRCGVDSSTSQRTSSQRSGSSSKSFGAAVGGEFDRQVRIDAAYRYRRRAARGIRRRLQLQFDRKAFLGAEARDPL